jgi:hypothetical protein
VGAAVQDGQALRVDGREAPVPKDQLSGPGVAPNMLYQSKASTLDIERNNGRQRHWLARFRRSSIVVTKSLPNLDALMTLFARFRTNGMVSEFMRMIKQGTIYL